MDSMRSVDKPITFRSIAENPAIQKPALVQIGSKSLIIGEKITGEYISASPCRVSNNRRDVREHELVLSSKYSGIWKVLSKATTTGETHIHRLTSKDIERINRQDNENRRSTPRTYVCTRDIDAFELIANSNDPKVYGGKRVERKKKLIEENTEFEISEVGEVEYTPTEGERTSQDYIAVPKNKSGAILELFLPGIQDMDHLVRNRVLRTLYCTIRKDGHKRRFLVEVNEEPCDIRPIASEGSTELRYLHSTKNLFDYLLNHGTDTFLYVKLLRGDVPTKAIDYDGYLVLKQAVKGDFIPVCRTDNLQLALINPDFSSRVKLPSNDQSWRSKPEIRAAEIQCMQLGLKLLSRHESECYVTLETSKTHLNIIQSSQNQQAYNRQISYSKTKQEDEYDQPVNTNKYQTMPNKYGEVDRYYVPTENSHAASDKLYRDDARRSLQEHLKAERQRIEQGERYTQSTRQTVRNKPSTTASLSYNTKSKTNVI